MQTQTQYLTLEQLRKNVPSIFATQKGIQTSEKYSHIPTTAIVEAMLKEGFGVVKANQTKSIDEEKIGHAKHLLRFRHVDQKPVNGLFPEIVLLNSHDGTSAYQIRAGIFRQVCTNGLVVGNDYFCERIRHSGDVVNKVLEATHNVVTIVPEIMEIANSWENKPLTIEHKKVYAEAAASLKWEEEEQKISADKLLTPRRQADTKQDIWTTFNVVQENLIKGGLRYRDNQRNNRTRGVNSVSENTRLNTALWTLTEKLSSLV